MAAVDDGSNANLKSSVWQFFYSTHQTSDGKNRSRTENCVFSKPNRSHILKATHALLSWRCTYSLWICDVILIQMLKFYL